MDFDIEMDMDDAVEAVPFQEPEPVMDILLIEDDQEPGEIHDTTTGDVGAVGDDPESRQIIPTKIHLRGLDTFKPDDVKAYVSAHSAAGTYQRIEWIDDNSANLVFASESSAQETLVSLSAVEIADPTQLPPLESLPGKPYEAKPTASLQVRFAVATDKKVRGASERSRFYLLNPEFDPEERRRRDGRYNRRYRDRDGDRPDRGRYDRDRRGDRRGGRYDGEAPEKFDVSLYDDDEDALAKRASRAPQRSRRDSRSSDSDTDRRRSYARQNAEKELFPDRRAAEGINSVSSRNRSASPIRDGDGDRTMDNVREKRAVSRNRETARSIKDRITRTQKTTIELFPSKVSKAPSTAQMDQIESTTRLASGRKNAATTSSKSSDTFSIKGLASQRGSDQGFAIKGTGASVKELFPDKFGNAGKELFADRLEGRGRRRQRAEDLFH